MKNLVILVKMQLKEQLNFKRVDVEGSSVFHVVLSVLAAVLKFALVTVLCGAFLIVSRYLGLFSSSATSIPDSVISFVFFIMIIMSMISCIIGITKSMYYARDNAVLLTLPCKPIEVYLSKLIIFFAFELKRNFSFTVPLFLAYYITQGNYSAGVYPWMLFCVLLISLFTVAFGSLMSIPAMIIATFFRQRKWLQSATIAVAIIGATVGFLYLVSLIPPELDFLGNWEVTQSYIRLFFADYKSNFSFVYDTTKMLLGESAILSRPQFPIGTTALRAGILFAITAVMFAIGFLIVQPLFYKMASTPFEYLKKQTPPRKNVRHGRRFSAVFNEFLIAVKSSDRMAANLGILVATPLLLLLLNKLLFAMDISRMGFAMIVAFNILISFMVLLNSNVSAASIFSRDGRASYLIKTQPSKYPILILSKLLPNASFAGGSIILSFIVLLISAEISVPDVIMLTVATAAAYVAHMLYCAELDLMNPQIELYATVGASESNPNETKATVTAFLVSFLAAGVMFLLLIEVPLISPYLKLMLVAAAALAYRTHIFFTKLNVYYKEK